MFGKYRRRRKHGRTRRERFRQCRIAVGGSFVDQEKIDRDDLRLQPRDRLDDLGYLGARQRIGAAELTMASSIATIVTTSAAPLRRAPAFAHLIMPSSRSRNRKWPLVWPSHIAPAQNPVQSNAARI